jgi:hypothetical protein
MKLFDVYPLFDISLVKGKGCYVWDDKGNKYLDLYGGHAVISIGHAHPYFQERITKQLAALPYYSNSVHLNIQDELAEKLGKISTIPLQFRSRGKRKCIKDRILSQPTQNRHRVQRRFSRKNTWRCGRYGQPEDQTSGQFRSACIIFAVQRQRSIAKSIQ